MRLRSLHALSLSIFALLLIPAVSYAAGVQDWLMKINRAANTLNYQGTFVYQHDGELQCMRIVHKAENGSAREHLVFLNDSAREVIRNDREVRFYLPDQNSVIVEHRKADIRRFPAVLPESLNNLDKNYKIQLGKSGRVADRQVQAVIIKPRDKYRYGYQLWADQETGLVLKANLIDSEDKIIEQFMFTQVSIGIAIPDTALQPRTTGKQFVMHDKTVYVETDSSAADSSGWVANQLPQGFLLSTRVLRKLPQYTAPMEHLVYSDGMAVVSVFVEKPQDKNRPAAIDGLINLGAVHAYGKAIDDHQITVVGEVPAATVDMIGESMAPGP